MLHAAVMHMKHAINLWPILGDSVSTFFEERGAELALQRAGQGAARHIVGRTIGESLRMTEHAAMHALKAMVPVV